MASIAKVTLVGNLGGDPETRYTPNGTMNVKFSVAVSRRWNDQAGQLQEETTWFRITAWSKLAETLDRLTQQGAMAKGKQVYVSGNISANEWTDNQGLKRTSIEVRADDVLLVGSRTDAEGAAGQAQPRSAAGSAKSNDEAGSFPSDFDDVPF